MSTAYVPVLSILGIRLKVWMNKSLAALENMAGYDRMLAGPLDCTLETSAGISSTVGFVHTERVFGMSSSSQV
jgi:hypothetical protein